MNDHDRPDADAHPDPAGESLLDFAAPLGRLGRLLPVLAVAAVVGGAIEAVLVGPSAGMVVRWTTLLGVVAIAVLAVLTAVHALTGADRAQRRGERLASDDVRLRPPLPGRSRRD